MVWKPDYVTLPEGKGFVRINDALDDAELSVIITAASRGIDDHCNRQFGVVAAEARLYTATFDYDRWRWVIDVDDFMSTAGGSVTIGGVVTTDYVKEPVNAAQEGKPWTALSIDGRTGTVLPTGVEYEVSAVMPWGWTAVPPTVKLGTRLQLSRFLARRDSPYGIAGTGDTQLRLLSRLDPDVAVSLRGFVRPRKVG